MRTGSLEETASRVRACIRRTSSDNPPRVLPTTNTHTAENERDMTGTPTARSEPVAITSPWTIIAPPAPPRDETERDAGAEQDPR